MVPWYIKHTNCASTVGEREGGGKKLEKSFWSEYQKVQPGGYGNQLYISMAGKS